MAHKQNIKLATGTKRGREDDEERKVQPNGKRMKVYDLIDRAQNEY